MRITTLIALGFVAMWLALFAVFVLIGGSVASAAAAWPLVATLAMVLVGAAIAVRRPSNAIGWMFCCGGLGFLAEGLSATYAERALVVAPGSLPAGVAVAWLASWIQYPVTALAAYLLLLFPSGHLPARSWRPVAWLAAIATGLLALAAAFRPGTLGVGQRAVPVPALNPLGSEALAGSLEIAAAIGAPLFLLVLAASVVALARRFRAARGEERQQLKWFVYATATSIALVIGSRIASASLPEALRVTLSFVTFGAAIAAFPVSVGIALLRYRLYDIDVLINRTVVYGATSAAIGATFFAGIVGLQAVISPLTSGSELAVAASTLVSFALFQPILRRVQGAVDRRFDRSRYDAARTLDAFADRLRDEVDLDALRADLIGAVRQTMAPAHSSLWLRERPR